MFVGAGVASPTTLVFGVLTPSAFSHSPLEEGEFAFLCLANFVFDIISTGNFKTKPAPSKSQANPISFLEKVAGLSDCELDTAVCGG